MNFKYLIDKKIFKNLSIYTFASFFLMQNFYLLLLSYISISYQIKFFNLNIQIPTEFMINSNQKFLFYFGIASFIQFKNFLDVLPI